MQINCQNTWNFRLWDKSIKCFSRVFRIWKFVKVIRVEDTIWISLGSYVVLFQSQIRLNFRIRMWKNWKIRMLEKNWSWYLRWLLMTTESVQYTRKHMFGKGEYFKMIFFSRKVFDACYEYMDWICKMHFFILFFAIFWNWLRNDRQDSWNFFKVMLHSS